MSRADSRELSEWVAFYSAREKLGIKDPGEKQDVEEMKKMLMGIAGHQERVDKWPQR